MNAPEWLSDVGQQKWYEMLDNHPNLANAPDQFAMLCDAWASYLMAVKDVNTMGLYIRSGERVWNNPAVATKEQERKSVIKLSTILGLIREGAEDDAPSALKALIENR